MLLGANSERYVPIVTISRPIPTPETKRQKFSRRRRLERQHDVGRRVPQQRIGEDRPPPEFVGEKTAGDRADEQAGEQCGDEARHPGRAEQARRRWRQDAGLDEAWRDVGRKQEVVELEKEAEAEQHE